MQLTAESKGTYYSREDKLEEKTLVTDLGFYET